MHALKHFRDNLRSLLESRGESQRAFSERIECSYTYLNQVLQGKSEPSLTFCDRVADAFKLDFSVFLLNPRKFRDEVLTGHAVTR